MPGYQVKHEHIAIEGAADLHVRSLLNRQQFVDPLGLAAAQGISSAAWPLFGLVWPAGLHLAAAMLRRPVVVGERILEIGCGLALASLVSHRRGADVTASDCHPMAAAFLLENLRLNGLMPMPYGRGNWADSGADEAVATDVVVTGRFDLIIGSDVLYERDDAGVLAAFIERHATDNSEVLIVDPNRSNRSPFHRRMRENGYVLQETRLAPLLGPAPSCVARLLHYRRPA